MPYTWISPDGQIQKQVLEEGKWGYKPYEGSECTIKFKDCPLALETYKDSTVIVGNNDFSIGRSLDLCLMTMHEDEISKFIVNIEPPLEFTMHLTSLKFNGFIHKWDAKKKYDFALQHKTKGVELFKENKTADAAHRFTKALRIILSIPLDVEIPPTSVDGVTIEELDALKSNLFNNMASCYLRSEVWDLVIEFCIKVFKFDRENVKAIYKIGVAYRNDKNYEQAAAAFKKVLEHEPDHKAAREHLQFVQLKLKEAQVRMNSMMKKMISDVIS